MRSTASILIILVFAAFIQAQTTQFTYQGRLTDGTIPPTGTYQMQFTLYASLADDDPIGSTITDSSVDVTQGVFTVRLAIDVADAFNGDPRWLAIAVKRAADPDYTALNPRQPLTSAPYAIKSLNASAADLAEDSTKLGGRDASEYIITTVGPAPPQSGNFNVSGTGTLGSLAVGNGSASTPAVSFTGDTDTGMFRSAADTLDFSTAGVSRIQIGPDGRIGIGTAPTSNSRLSVFEPGSAPGTGTGGSFGGGSIGVSGFGNGTSSTSFTWGVLGSAGGTAGGRVGVGAFSSAEPGVDFGYGVLANASGPAQVNFGVYGSASGGATNWAGYFDGNTFTGGSGIIRARVNSDVNAGVALSLNNQPGWSMATVTGGQFQIFNDFLGQNAVWIQRANNSVGIGTTSPGARLDVLGNINTSTQYNIAGNRVLGNPGSFNLFAGVNSGASLTPGSGNAFFGYSSGALNTGSENSFFGFQAGGHNQGCCNSFFGRDAGAANTSGQFNSFFGGLAGSANTLGRQNTFFGNSAGKSNTTGSNNTMLGYDADVSSPGLQFATAIGSGARINRSNQIVLGRSAGQDEVVMPGNTFVSAALSANTFTANSAVLGAVHLVPQGANPGSCSAPIVGTIYYRAAELGVDGGLIVCRDSAVGTFEWIRVTDGTIQSLTAASPEKLTETLNSQKAQIERQQKEIESLKKIVCELKTSAGICKEEK